jgi:hypothetical protein
MGKCILKVFWNWIHFDATLEPDPTFWFDKDPDLDPFLKSRQG